MEVGAELAEKFRPDCVLGFVCEFEYPQFAAKAWPPRADRDLFPGLHGRRDLLEFTLGLSPLDRAGAALSEPHVEPSGSCPHCGRPTYGGAAYCKARRCPHYAPIWARDQQRKLFENLGAYDSGDGHGVMFTITAPGAGDLPWDEEHCAPLGNHRHSGLLGCRVAPRAAEEWNQSCSARYGLLRVAARRLTRRRLGSGCHNRHYRALKLFGRPVGLSQIGETPHKSSGCGKTLTSLEG
jgi:hypothetical protein